MLEKLKEEVYEANMSLVKNNLVILTWGNVSGIDRESNYIVIKPSGVEYDSMSPDDMVIVDMSGNVVEGKYKPSSDTPTHLALYNEYSDIGGVAHTHSKFATIFAQTNPATGIPALGTTHADYFNGVIPVTRLMKKKEILGEYEKNTGLVIIETLQKLKFTPEDMPACLVASHGPFTWGKDAKSAAEYSYILENVAELAYFTRQMTTGISLSEPVIQRELLEKHFYRKHGKNAYYGQN